MNQNRPAFEEYETAKDKCVNFLETYDHAINGDRRPKYMQYIAEVHHRSRKVIEIELDDLLRVQFYFLASNSPQFSPMDETFVQKIEKNTLRYIDIFCKAVDYLLPSTSTPDGKEDTFDVLWEYRKKRERAVRSQSYLNFFQVQSVITVDQGAQPLPEDVDSKIDNFPVELKRR
jgi:hypothetical protein